MQNTSSSPPHPTRTHYNVFRLGRELNARGNVPDTRLSPRPSNVTLGRPEKEVGNWEKELALR
jgi:hypothetical protein